MGSFQPPKFSSSTPHFFKIILDAVSRDKLIIPKKFVKKYGGELSNSASLKLPSGCEWEVELTRCNDKIWFEKGWPEFAMFYSLDYGNFLLFRYEGNSRFHVFIFDTSATEIDYPVKVPNIERTDEDDGVSAQIMEDFSPNPKTREKSPLPRPPSKKMRTSLSSKADIISGDDSSTQPCDMIMFEKPTRNKGADDLSDQKNEDLTGGSSGTQSFRTETSQQFRGKILALQRAKDFKCENPSFISPMQLSDIQCSLSLPLKFSMRHLIKHPSSDILLRVSDGRTWSVELTCTDKNARFQRGWLTFVKDNNLEVGDVCVFVLIKDIKLMLRVVFFRTSKATNWFSSHNQKGQKPLTTSEGAKAYGNRSYVGKKKSSSGQDTQSPSSSMRVNVEVANKFASRNPFFKVILGSWHLEKSTVNVPADIARNFITQGKKTVFLRVKDRSWPVNVIKYESSRVTAMCGGWAAFSKANCLREGDICIFELMDTKDIVLEVHIIRR